MTAHRPTAIVDVHSLIARSSSVRHARSSAQSTARTWRDARRCSDGGRVDGLSPPRAGRHAVEEPRPLDASRYQAPEQLQVLGKRARPEEPLADALTGCFTHARRALRIRQQLDDGPCERLVVVGIDEEAGRPGDDLVLD